jgi:hypothetical protein
MDAPADLPLSGLIHVDELSPVNLLELPLPVFYDNPYGVS